MKRTMDFDLTVTFWLAKSIVCKKSANYPHAYMQKIKTVTVLCVLKIVVLILLNFLIARSKMN